jgi:transposase
MRVRPTYSDEFRADALSLLERTDRSLNEVANDLGVSPASLRDWYRKRSMANKTRKPRLVPVERKPSEESAEAKLARLERENERLRKEVDSLRMDREILKKAAAFFAKESE